MHDISASIVLYHDNIELITRVIRSFLSTELSVKLYLVDNSENDVLRELSKIDDKIDYIFNNKNLGYGRAHNIALRKSIDMDVSYHVILNPDVYFDSDTIGRLYRHMQSNKNIGNIMPKILFPSGEVQYFR
jgi:GT2 family glycosyltransferase